jgi:hypothetical protein
MRYPTHTRRPQIPPDASIDCRATVSRGGAGPSRARPRLASAEVYTSLSRTSLIQP